MLGDYQERVLEYFKGKAADYDAVDKQPYWCLSDDLLWKLLIDSAIAKLPQNFSFLDAGGGTGRWSSRILKAYLKATGTVRDISPDMLLEARKKQQEIGLERLDIQNGSIDDMSDVPDNSFDLVFNFHNVIGFLPDTKCGIREMVRILKPGGYLVTVAPNRLHMAYFNILLGKLDEAVEALLHGQGRFTSNMPPIKNFTPSQLSELYKGARLSDIHAYGFPKLIYPGYAETQLFGSTKQLGDILGRSASYDNIRELEESILFDDESASRGNNLFVIGRK